VSPPSSHPIIITKNAKWLDVVCYHCWHCSSKNQRLEVRLFFPKISPKGYLSPFGIG
jgi:hypothetical protein